MSKKPITKKVTKKVSTKKEEGTAEAVSLQEDIKSIDTIRLNLLKKFGTNSVMNGADLEISSYGRFSTGSIALDMALGGGK